MTGRFRYAATAVALVAFSAAFSWPLVGPSAWTSILVVGLLAVVVQFVLFTMLSGAYGDPRRFMMSWALGMASRLAFVALVGTFVTVSRVGDPTVAVLSAAGFVFALHLLEPVFLGTPDRSEYAR